MTFAEDVAPLLYQHCSSCHRPGLPAPFGLLTYEDARSHAAQIADAVASRRMPPWLPSAGYGEFAGDRRLTDEEVATIERWVETGSREGDSAQIPPPPKFTEGWQLGEPDLVVEMAQPYVLPGGGSDEFRNFVIPVPLDSTRYVRAVEIRPGNPRIVHHAVLTVDPTRSSRQLDAEDPRPGFGGMATVGDAHSPEGFFVGWTPGKVPSRSPEGLAWKLDRGSDLVLLLHLRPAPDTESVQAKIGLYFADRPPTLRPVLIHLGSQTLDIPAGARNYAIADSFTLPVDVQVLSIYPHAHYLGKTMQVDAVLPDGSRRWLLRIDHWNFHWQDEYRYKDPVALPAGTTLHMRYTYDNSADNPSNPHDPPIRVVFGPRSTDEMGDLWLQSLPRDSVDGAVLRRALGRKEIRLQMAGMRQMIRLDPNRADAHYALANDLKSLGQTAQAVEHYRKALEIEPDLVGAHNNLANVLRAQGQLDEAIGHYREALRIEPDNATIHFNLGDALRDQGKLDDAIAQYRQAVTLKRDYARAHYSLADALRVKGRSRAALAEYRETSRLEPGSPVPLVAMVWLLAADPDASIRDPAEALRLAERAAALTGGRHPIVLDALATAHAAAGHYDRAVALGRQAVAIATSAGAPSQVVSTLQAHLAGYERAFRSGTWSPHAPPDR